jgi:hypothetical protein
MLVKTPVLISHARAIRLEGSERHLGMTQRQSALRWLILLSAFLGALGIFGSASIASAKDIYIGQNSSGAANGSDCNDAYAYAFFNNSANWGSGATQIGPGTNVHLCGTFTGAVGQTLLIAPGSGASGNPVTIVFEPGAVLTSPQWPATGAIVINGQSWITIDGGANGTIQNTLNGTSGGPCTAGPCSIQSDSRFVYITGSSSNILVKNLIASNAYVHSSATDNCCGGTAAVYFLNQNNVTVDHVTCHDSRACIDGWGNSITVSNNTFYNCADCWNYGTNAPTASVIVYGNHIYDPANWDTTSHAFHLDGIHFYPNSGTANLSGLVVYNNLFEAGGLGNTAHLSLEGGFSSPAIFNNVFNNNPAYHMPALEMWTDGGIYAITNPIIVNNTFMGGDETFGGNVDVFINDTGITGITLENNVVTGGNTLVSVNPGSSFIAINHNVYENIFADGGANQVFGYNGASYSTLTSWRAALPAATGQDSASLFDTISQIALASGGQLNHGSSAIGEGINLTSLGITALDTDRTGAPRPTTGPWDAGAFASSGATSLPAAPTGLTATVQ